MKTPSNKTAFESASCKVNLTKPYAIELIETAFQSPWNSIPTNADLRRLRSILPYCFKEIDSCNVMPINRDYMPLGIGYSLKFVNYGAPEFASLRLLSADLDRLLLRPGEYLFNDICSPLTGNVNDRSDYFLRLWWTLRHYGLTFPNLQIPVIEKSANRCGIRFQQVLKEVRS
jgi:hypothetical protein